jgi:hypothetical protein
MQAQDHILQGDFLVLGLRSLLPKPRSNNRSGAHGGQRTRSLDTKLSLANGSRRQLRILRRRLYLNDIASRGPGAVNAVSGYQVVTGRWIEEVITNTSMKIVFERYSRPGPRPHRRGRFLHKPVIQAIAKQFHDQTNQSGSCL